MFFYLSPLPYRYYTNNLIVLFVEIKKEENCIALYTLLYWTVLNLLYFLYCTALFCIIIYCTVLYCTVLHCTVLYCTLLYCTVLYFTLLYCTVLYCTLLYCTVLLCTALYRTVLFDTTVAVNLHK